VRNNSKRIEINSHFVGINDMIFSPDEQNLFTAGKDNCLIIWNVKEREINYTREKESTLPWATELLISAEAKKSQQDKKRTLQNDIQESKYENEKKIDVERMKFQTSLTEMKDEKLNEIDKLEHKYQDLVKTKLDQQQNQQKEMDKIINTHEKDKSEKENHLELQWQSKKNEISRLNEEINRIVMQNSSELEAFQEKQKEEIDILKNKNSETLNNLKDDINKRQTELKELKDYNKQEIKEVE